MAGKSSYLETAWLNHVLRTTPLAQTAYNYVSLFDLNEVEIVGNGYGRAPIARNDSSWSAPTGTPRYVTNAVVVAFPVPTPNGWGDVAFFGIHDSLGGGNLLYYAALAFQKTVLVWDDVVFPVGSLRVTED